MGVSRDTAGIRFWRSSGSGRRMLLAGLPLAFLGLFYFYPLADIFMFSFAPHGSFRLDGLEKLFSRPYYGRVIWFTFWQAAASTLLTVSLALPVAYIFGRFRFPAKGLVQTIVTIPFVLPTVVVAAAFQALMGSDGLVNLLAAEFLQVSSPLVHMDHSIWAILLAHVFYNIAVVARIVGSFWSGLDTSLEESARMLGAGGWQVFWRVTFPLLRPAVLSAALLVFIFCFSSFGVVLILGGPAYTTIEVEIYRQAVHIFNLPMAATLSIIQIIFTFTLMWRYTRLQEKVSISLMPGSLDKNCRRVAKRGDKIVVGTILSLLLVFLIVPLAALVARSLLTENGISWFYYRALFADKTGSIFFVPPQVAIAQSLSFALVTLGMAVPLGLAAAAFLCGPANRISRWLDPIFMLPLSTSAVTLGFGFIIALDEPPLNLRTAWILVPIAHSLVAFPFVVRSVLPALKSIPAGLRESATVLGAGAYQVWRHIDLPIAGRALIVGAVFAFTISLGEFGATAFIARPDTPTMPVVIYRLLGQPGSLNFGQAMAMSSLLMAVTTIGFLLMEKCSPGPKTS